MNKLIIISVTLLWHSAVSFAETQITISPSFLYFDYTEFSTTDQVLNTETGWLPGLDASLSHAITSNWLLSLNTAYYQGVVDYDGQTQQGVPHTTDTDTGLFRLGARVDRLILKDTYLFAGAQAHRWERDINDKNNVSGIDETYEWHEFSFGLNTNFAISHRDLLQVEASFLLTRNATVFVDLTRAGLGTTTLDLGDGTGGRLNLNWIRRYNSTFSYGLGIFLEGWQFGRSNTKPLENSSSLIYVTEPRSETINTGLKLNIEYMF